MLDSDIISQLTVLFGTLEEEIILSYSKSDHPKQDELIFLLNQITSTSSRLKLSESAEKTSLPTLKIFKENVETGISFVGIPSGHEFSSLVLAILNASGKGKFPDQLIIDRIKNIKPNIDLTTYVSLNCENCPEVVQALNIICVINPRIKHKMVDGGLAQDEIKQLGIQGVPTIVSDNKLIFSGKASLIDLVRKLEDSFGVQTQVEKLNKHNVKETFDVLVLGAGPSGAAAAIYTARKGLKTAIVTEKIGGQIKETKGIENLISVKYTEGPKLASQLLQHIEDYNISILDNRKVIKIETGKTNTISLDSGELLESKSIIVATGAKWRELGVPGEKEYIGRGVAFCPHCDGPYFKKKDIVVIGGGNSGVEAAIDLSTTVNSLTLFEYSANLKADKVLVDKLNSIQNIKIIKNAKIKVITGDGIKVTGLEFENTENNTTEYFSTEGIFIQIGLVPNSDFIKNIVDTNSSGEIIIDEKCRTNVAGIYAAGDVTNVPYKQIIVAMGEGAKAGLTSFEDIMLK